MPHVQDAWKVLSNEQFPAGRIVVIGGGLVGAETAEYLALRGNDVSIVEMMDTIAKEESTTIRPEMMADFEKLPETVDAALQGKQIQPILLR